MPEDTLSKLNAVLSRQLERPMPPSRPETVRLDALEKELQQAKQIQDPMLHQAAVAKVHDSWKREYDKFLAETTAPAPTPPAPTPIFIPPPPLSPTPTPSHSPVKTYSQAALSPVQYELSKPSTYSCSRCGKTFKTKSWQTKHLLQVHGLWQGVSATPKGSKRLPEEKVEEPNLSDDSELGEPEYLEELSDDESEEIEAEYKNYLKKEKRGKGIKIFFPASSRR